MKKQLFFLFSLGVAATTFSSQRDFNTTSFTIDPETQNIVLNVRVKPNQEHALQGLDLEQSSRLLSVVKFAATSDPASKYISEQTAKSIYDSASVVHGVANLGIAIANLGIMPGDTRKDRFNRSLCRLLALLAVHTVANWTCKPESERVSLNTVFVASEALLYTLSALKTGSWTPFRNHESGLQLHIAKVFHDRNHKLESAKSRLHLRIKKALS